MNLCIFIGKRQYANEVHIWCRKSAKLDRFARINLEKSIETDKWLIGSKSTNHRVNLPMNRRAFSFNHGLDCPSSSSSLPSSSSCSASLVPSRPFGFSIYTWVNSKHKCSFNATMIDEEVIASYGPLGSCGPCLDHIWSCIEFVVPSVLMRTHQNVFDDHKIIQVPNNTRTWNWHRIPFNFNKTDIYL